MSGWGPWSPTCHRDQRALQLRSLAALVACHCGSAHPLVKLLRAAETCPMSFTEAQARFEQLPALTKRKVLALFAAITWRREP